MAKSSEYKQNHLENPRIRHIYNTDQKESYTSQHIPFVMKNYLQCPELQSRSFIDNLFYPLLFY